MSNTLRKGRTPRISRRVKSAWSYGPVLRLADSAHGRQDARTAAEDGLVLMPWFVRMSSTRLENDQRQFSCRQDDLRDSVSELNEAFGRLTDLDARVRVLAGRVAEIAPANLKAAGGAEQHLSQEAIAVRRAREHRAKVDACQAQVSAVRGQQQSLVGDCLKLRAQIVEEFELAQAVSERMRHYYSRRICTYARRLGRGRASSGDLEFRLEPAAWTTAPCPWLPLGLDARLSAPIVAASPAVNTDMKES